MPATLFPETYALGSSKRRLGDLLIERGYATIGQVADAGRLQEESHGQQLLNEILVERGDCTEEQVLECLAAEMDLPFAKLDNRLCDPNIVDSLPREFLEKHALLPLFRIRDMLTVAVPDATDVFLLDRLRDLAQCDVQVVIATARDIRKLQQTLLAQGESGQKGSDSADSLTGGDRPVVDRNAPPPAATVVQNLLTMALREGATDVHLEPSERALRVRFRVDGVLFEHQQLSRSAIQPVAECLRTMAHVDLHDHRPQEGGFQFTADDRTAEVRLHTLPVVHGEKISLKLVDGDGQLPTLDRLGFSGEILQSVQRRLALKRGLVLVTGPKGSGKSATLYAALNLLSQSAVNICTVEDPVECRLPFANQSRVEVASGLTVATLLRALLRQDADVLMAHQLTDLETSQLAVQAALGGSLVLSTLETSDSCSGVAWLRDMGLEGYHLAGSVNMILAQRLCRRVCTKCRKTYEPSKTTLQTVDRMGLRAPTFYRGGGCPHCRQTGYKGRIAIHELLIIDEELREMLSARSSLGEIRSHVQARGTLCLRYDGLSKAREGLTTPEEVIRVTDEGWVPQRRTANP